MQGRQFSMQRHFITRAADRVQPNIQLELSSPSILPAEINRANSSSKNELEGLVFNDFFFFSTKPL